MFNSNLKSQTINIDSTFTADAEIYPFSPNDTITGLSISGSIELYSDTSLIRIILVDEDYNEYMVYEAYPMIVPDTAFDIVEECDETCYLNEIIPNYLQIYIINSSFEFSSITLTYEPIDNIDSLKHITKLVNDLEKVANINFNIEDRDFIWRADTNEVALLFYCDKKNIYGSKYNLQGFDYYVGGIFDLTNGYPANSPSDGIVDNFDWRKKHDANKDPELGNPYYRGYTGWISPFYQKQKCNHCWIFAPVAAVESMINLFYNDIVIKYDLSEQQLASCVDETDNCDGGYAEWTLDYIQSDGVVDEYCLEYEGLSALQVLCNEVCTIPEDIIKISSYSEIAQNVSSIKEALITKGPVVTLLDNWWHYMLTVGYGKIELYDTIYIGSSSIEDSIIITDPNSTYIGKHYWIFKNSRGNRWGNRGFCNVLIDIGELTENYAVKYPLISENYSFEDIQILDHDRDGYYNWGIANYEYMHQNGWEAPCDTNSDCNDNNNRIGPYDGDFRGIPVAPEMKVYLGHPDFGGVLIRNNEFIYFTDDDLQNGKLSFYIKNTGDALINLVPENPVYEIQNFDSCFILDTSDVDTQICFDPGNNLTGFEIEFKSECQISYDTPPVAVYEIDVHSTDEDVLEDFKFALVYYDCGSASGTDTIHLYTNEEWSDYKVITKDVQIETGATLLITGNIEFTEGADVFVEGGAELVIDGGILSGACGEFWNGIDVWGNNEHSQYDGHQGKVKVKNGGTLAHAHCGIETGRFVPGYYIPSGGIVSSNGAIFRDNIIGVRFHPYHNFHPQTGDPTGNISGFKNTSFVTTQEIYDMGEEPEGFVDLNWVEGILFKGNTYKNEAVTASGEDRGIGIKGATAGFYVYNVCAVSNASPCPEYLISSFEHLDYGIKVFGERESLPIVIDSAVFHDNLRGIFISGMNGFEIYHNSFEMDVLNSAHETNDTLCGIYLEACRDFLLAENYVKGYSGTQMKHAGIYVSNLGPYYNEIYNNSIENISCGIVAAGENRNGEAEGLCIYCNDITDCQYDVYVIPYGGVNVNQLGIHLQQGDFGYNAPPGVDPNTMAAGNTFTSDDYVDMVYSYYNHPDLDWIQYIHHTEIPDIELRPNPFNRINRQEDILVDYSKDTSCPTILDYGIDVLVEQSNLSIEANQIEAYQDTLEQFVDGGDTDNLNSDVQTSFPDEALQVRQELLDESPYLSDTVMKSAIFKENVLPNAMVRDILVANPQSAKSAAVINALYQRFDPMPDYMMAEIMNGLINTGAKEVLEKKLARHSSLRGKSFSKLYRHYNNDTINACATDSLLVLFQDEQSPDRRYQLAFIHLNKDDSIQVINTLNNIPIEFDLTDEQESIHDLYEDLFDVLLSYQSDSTGLDSLQVKAFQDIAVNNYHLPAIYARNILDVNGCMNHRENIYLPANLKSTPSWELSKPEIHKRSLFNVFPNPANSYLIIEYDIRDIKGNAVIILSDVFGKHISSLNLVDRQDQKIIGIKSYTAGIYIIQLILNNELLEAKKIHILK